MSIQDSVAQFLRHDNIYATQETTAIVALLSAVFAVQVAEDCIKMSRFRVSLKRFVAPLGTIGFLGILKAHIATFLNFRPNAESIFDINTKAYAAASRRGTIQNMYDRGRIPWNQELFRTSINLREKGEFHSTRNHRTIQEESEVSNIDTGYLWEIVNPATVKAGNQRRFWICLGVTLFQNLLLVSATYGIEKTFREDPWSALMFSICVAVAEFLTMTLEIIRCYKSSGKGNIIFPRNIVQIRMWEYLERKYRIPKAVSEDETIEPEALYRCNRFVQLTAGTKVYQWKLQGLWSTLGVISFFVKLAGSGLLVAEIWLYLVQAQVLFKGRYGFPAWVAIQGGIVIFKNVSGFCDQYLVKWFQILRADSNTTIEEASHLSISSLPSIVIHFVKSGDVRGAAGSSLAVRLTNTLRDSDWAMCTACIRKNIGDVDAIVRRQTTERRSIFPAFSRTSRHCLVNTPIVQEAGFTWATTPIFFMASRLARSLFGPEVEKLLEPWDTHSLVLVGCSQVGEVIHYTCLRVHAGPPEDLLGIQKKQIRVYKTDEGGWEAAVWSERTHGKRSRGDEVLKESRQFKEAYKVDYHLGEVMSHYTQGPNAAKGIDYAKSCWFLSFKGLGYSIALPKNLTTVQKPDKSDDIRCNHAQKKEEKPTTREKEETAAKLNEVRIKTDLCECEVETIFFDSSIVGNRKHSIVQQLSVADQEVWIRRSEG